MNMIRDHNLTSHTYNEEITFKIDTSTLDEYFKMFKLFQVKMSELERDKEI